MNKQAAYNLGVQAALQDAGLVKQADGDRAQALEALSHNQMGTLAGMGIGTAGGAGLGALIAALLKEPGIHAGHGALLGGVAGMLPGALIGHGLTRVPENLRQHITAGDIYL